MILDNIHRYPYLGAIRNITDPVKTTNGSTAYLVSNDAGLYGVTISAVPDHADVLFVTDNYSFAAQQHAALAATPKYDPEYPYEAFLNGESRGEFRDLDGEDVISWGSGVRRGNTIQVYHKGELVLDVDTEDGQVVTERVRHEMTKDWK